MKKKFLTIALALAMALACAFNVIACGSSSKSTASNDGQYYMYNDGEYSEDNYVKISNNKVTEIMQDGHSLKEAGCKFSTTINGKNFSVTVTGMEDMKAVYFCEINNGVIRLTLIELYDSNDNLKQSQSYDEYFCKKNKTPDDFGGNGDGPNINNTPEDYTPEGFVPSNYPVDNSFKGALSAQSYSSPEVAAQAFLTNEISGEATQANFNGYTKTDDLDDTEIRNLNVRLEADSSITSAERGEVQYTDGTDSQAKNATKAGGVSAVKIKKLTIYIICIDYSDYKYFAPELNKGDVITKSYYDEVFDREKYLNCTINEESVTTTKLKQGVQSVTITVTMTSSIQVTETASYLYTEIQTDYHGMMSNETTIIEIYIEYENNSRSYIRTDGGRWMQGNLVDVYDYIVPSMDNSFFIKADYGFTINSEKYSLFVQKKANEMLSSSGLNVNYNSLTMTAAFLVKDGRIDNVKSTLEGAYTASGVNGDVTASVTDSYSRFGTTEVPSKSSLGIN